MKINKDFAEAWRAGYFIDKRMYRAQQESAFDMVFAIVGILVLIILSIIF